MSNIGSEVARNTAIILLTFLFSFILIILLFVVFLYIIGHYVNWDKIISKTLGF